MVQSRSLALELFQNALFPTGLRAETAWLGIYQTLMWYEKVNIGNVIELPHIIEANNLRPPAGRTAEKLTIWGRRAQSVEQYLA